MSMGHKNSTNQQWLITSRLLAIPLVVWLPGNSWMQRKDLSRTNPSLLVKGFWQHNENNNLVNDLDLLKGGLISQPHLHKFGSVIFIKSSYASDSL
jgi:hypothetical protein